MWIVVGNVCAVSMTCKYNPRWASYPHQHHGLYISILTSVQCPCDVHDTMLAMILVSNLLSNGNLVRFELQYLSSCGGS